MKSKITFLAIFLFVFSACAKGGGSNKISGKLVNGLRHITINPEKSNQFTIYRGDYIKLKCAGKPEFGISIPALNITKEFPAADGQKDYIKMKKVGEYDFNSCNVKGKINVVEYNQPHYKAVTSVEGYKIIQNIKPLILDVRTPREYQMAHIAGSKLIPVQILRRQLSQLKDYKDKDIIIYCATGNRSTVASKILIDAGFKKIYNLRFGIADWMRNSLPVEK